MFILTDGQKTSVKAYQDGLEALDGTDLRLVDFETVQAATDNFSEANKIGQGGFGVVYKVITLFFLHHYFGASH